MVTSDKIVRIATDLADLAHGREVERCDAIITGDEQLQIARELLDRILSRARDPVDLLAVSVEMKRHALVIGETGAESPDGQLSFDRLVERMASAAGIGEGN